MRCVVAVLTLVIVLSFVVCLFVVSLRDEQGGVAFISGTGKFSAEHCTFSQNTAFVSPAARASLRLTFACLFAVGCGRDCVGVSLGVAAFRE